MGNPVVHFEITAKGIDRLHDFYGKVFGWKIDANNPFKYGMTDTGAGSGINGGIGETTGTPHVTVYIQVPSIDKALASVTAAGGKVAMEKATVPGGPTLAQFTDPSGHLIGLIEG
jgi:predicted enzyme related to lactoylglutathione lyase